MQRLDAATGVQYFKQTADIDLFGQIWTPIKFSGNFDGNGKTISNVKIDLPNSNYIGFFSTLSSGGELKNVRLENVDVKGKSYVGGLVGEASGSISNSYALGNVTGSSNYVGGLVGYTGITSSVCNSYASGSVTGSSFYVGGLVGAVFGKIFNSYASVNVKGFAVIGGLVGIFDTTSSISNSYYDREITNNPDNGKGIPRTTTEMKTGTPSETIYTGWDPAIWDFGDDTDYPKLRK